MKCIYLYNFGAKNLKTEKMEVQINYKGIDLIAKGNYTEGEYEIYYDDDLSGHPGSASEFEVQKIFVIDSDINIIELLYYDIEDITDLIIEEIEG